MKTKMTSSLMKILSSLILTDFVFILFLALSFFESAFFLFPFSTKFPIIKLKEHKSLKTLMCTPCQGQNKKESKKMLKIDYNTIAVQG